MSGRSTSFGAVAAAYERFRPGYPAELFDTVMRYARRPIRAALEIGAGTGKATRLFAERGVTVTATEPDAAMLAELRKHVPANVITVQVGFEDLRPAGHHMQWPATELQRSEWFTDVQQSVIERRWTMLARDYVGHLSTISAYLQLPPLQQHQTYGRIMQVLPESVDVSADITAHLARRRSQ